MTTTTTSPPPDRVSDPADELVVDLRGAQVAYTRKSDPVLTDVDLQVRPGEFVYLIGRSGSGKSTLLRALHGDALVSGGHARVVGSDITATSARKTAMLRRDLGVVHQDVSLLTDRDVAANIAFALQVTGRPARMRSLVRNALDMVGLAGFEQRDVRTLSGGQAQRVAIARAVVAGPTVLLADEPTGALDPQTTTEVMDSLARVNALGTAIIMATHHTELVDAGRRRVIEVVEGRITRDEASGTYLAQQVSA